MAKGLRWIWCTALVVALSAALGAMAPSAAGQQPAPDDPYGGTTTTAPDDPVPVRCILHAEVVSPGEVITVEIVGVVPGNEVRLLLAGSEVARGTAPVDEQSSGTTTMELSFVVPELPGGRYRLDAVGPTFTVGCSADGFVTVLGTAVLPAGPGALPRTDPVAGPGAGAGSGGLAGALPRTGTSIALLLAVALALLVAGRTLVDRARRRRRRHRRRPPARRPELARR